MRWPQWLRGLPNGVREGVVGAVLVGVVGWLTGLIVGLVVNPPTAWAAAFEIGLPGAFVGFLAGGAARVVKTNADESERRRDRT